LPRPLAPHPDFPQGASVRVRPLGYGATANRRRLVGRVGTVVKSSRSVVYVEFPGEEHREHYYPGQLDLA
jgi:hypothetical protein